MAIHHVGGGHFVSASADTERPGPSVPRHWCGPNLYRLAMSNFIQILLYIYETSQGENGDG